MNAHGYALLSQEAYSAKPDIGDPNSASRAIVRQTAGGLVIAFPGTDNADCVGADIDIGPTVVPGIGKVHRGFWQAWQAISTPVLAAIAGQPVTLVGHSLGAAIAVMAAASMTVSGNPPVAVFGFEPPRASPDLGLRALLAKVPLHLYWNGLDLVPSLPLDWQHAGMLTHIGKPAMPFPNVTDHAISRVIAALA
ncbi:alpha/beta fold hydrolase [Burkholderia lata]|uniref:alpha/beta fold hydrolase n=1 Tax=Burkholderia lata (strain ATCC 17760 / DSM 23089 / LMG 22485 / NCIMB 9086 / R18194 / 383) TaxID=482957 RepID=UPI0015833DDF|nr:alpha/beta fold hydrolase [Burkholderia lata]